MNQLLADRLARARSRCPHLRFGQLVVNALSTKVGGDDAALRRVLFYLTDEELVSAIEEFVAGVPRSGCYSLKLDNST